MFQGLRHTGIVVKDMDKALTFYRDLMGLSLVVDCVEEGPYIANLTGVDKARIRIVKLLVKAGTGGERISAQTKMRVGHDGMIELLQFLSPRVSERSSEITIKMGISHLAFAVENVDKLYEDWIRNGITFNHAPQISPDRVAKVVYCHDPDGTSIELVQMMS